MSKVCFGVDIGGTTVKLGMFDEEGVLKFQCEIPTRKEEMVSSLFLTFVQRLQKFLRQMTLKK